MRMLIIFTKMNLIVGIIFLFNEIYIFYKLKKIVENQRLVFNEHS